MSKRYVRRRTGGRRRWQDDPFPASGRQYRYRCPVCANQLELHDLKDGDQGYWCHHCGTGHRAGEPPVEAIQPLQRVLAAEAAESSGGAA